MKTSETRRQKVGLPDVNILIALTHPASRLGHLPDHRKRLRLNYGKPGYPFPGLTVNRVRGILVELVQVEGHRFWPDSFSMLAANRVDLTDAGSRHVTDLYLVGLARSFGGRMVTFDRTIR